MTKTGSYCKCNLYSGVLKHITIYHFELVLLLGKNNLDMLDFVIILFSRKSAAYCNDSVKWEHFAVIMNNKNIN